MAGGLAVVGLVIARYAELGLRCEGSRAHLDGVWDEAREHEVREAILGTGLPYAPDTWSRVDQRLDEYARAWVDKHTDVCEATSVRHELSPEVMDLRMACLQRANMSLRALTGLLAEADAQTVEKALGVVRGLPRLERCADVEALRADVAPPDSAARP